MKLLIADDDKVSRTALLELMGSPQGWEIVQVADGQAALDAICDGLRPDLCIVDLKMPRLDGMQLLQRLRRDPDLKSLKVVMTSATRDRDTILALAKLQISGYLLKPYDQTKTRAVLQPLLPTAANPILASRNLLHRTLLVIDDDPVTLEALRTFTTSLSHWDAMMVENARAALYRLRAGARPDLILTDLHMAEMDGLAFLREVRSDPALEKLRVAVMSTEQHREQLVALAQLKVFGYLIKPCVPAKVHELMHKAEAEAQT